MGQSTNGQLCWGSKFEEGFGFPWDEKKCEQDIEEWWLVVTGFEPPCNPYDDRGEYAEGFTAEDPRVEEYFEQRHTWKEKHPLPIELVNYCSGDAAMYILAIPRLCFHNYRGYPVEIDPAELLETLEDARVLSDFCSNYGIVVEKPRWWLSSYWG